MGTGVRTGWSEPCLARPLGQENTDDKTWRRSHRLPLLTMTSGKGWGRRIFKALSYLFSYLGFQFFQCPTATHFMSTVPEKQK